MFFIVRSFLIPFGAPRRVGAPSPAQRRRPPPAPLQALGGTSRRGFLLSPPPALPHSASPGVDLPSQPRSLNHHPYHPCPGAAHCSLVPRRGPRLALVCSPPAQLPAVPTCPVTKGIFPKHKSDHKALPSAACSGSLSPWAWPQTLPRPVPSPLQPH